MLQSSHLMAEDNSIKDLKTMERRIANLNNHLLPIPYPFSESNPIRFSPASAEDSYRRIHGEVSAEAAVWRPALVESGNEFTDILYEKAVGEGIAKITINRPERRNAFRPHTIKELVSAFNDARDDSSVGVIILTGKGTKAFCSGGDQALRTSDGYTDFENFGRLNVLDLQVQIRRLPKPVIAMVAGYAVGGGHVLHMVCDLTIAAENAIFGQTGPKVGSFDAGYGSSIMSRLVGPKKAKEMWFLSRFYNAYEAEKMGLVNSVVKLENLELETVKWCREILRNSPTAIRVLKSALNAVDDGHAGLQDIGYRSLITGCWVHSSLGAPPLSGELSWRLGTSSYLVSVLPSSQPSQPAGTCLQTLSQSSRSVLQALSQSSRGTFRTFLGAVRVSSGPFSGLLYRVVLLRVVCTAESLWFN